MFWLLAIFPIKLQPKNGPNARTTILSFEVGLILCPVSPAAAQGELQGDGRGGVPEAGQVRLPCVQQNITNPRLFIMLAKYIQFFKTYNKYCSFQGAEG